MTYPLKQNQFMYVDSSTTFNLEYLDDTNPFNFNQDTVNSINPNQILAQNLPMTSSPPITLEIREVDSRDSIATDIYSQSISNAPGSKSKKRKLRESGNSFRKKQKTQTDSNTNTIPNQINTSTTTDLQPNLIKKAQHRLHSKKHRQKQKANQEKLNLSIQTVIKTHLECFPLSKLHQQKNCSLKPALLAADLEVMTDEMKVYHTYMTEQIISLTKTNEQLQQEMSVLQQTRLYQPIPIPVQVIPREIPQPILLRPLTELPKPSS